MQNRILVADDEEIFRRSTVDILRGRGYEADGVRDAYEAYEATKTRAYDLVIADIKMDGNCELELVRKIANENQRIPLMIITGYPTLQSAVESVRLALADYLIKPVSPEEFLRRVEKALPRKDAPPGTEAAPSSTPPASTDALTLEQIVDQQIQEMYRAIRGLQKVTQLASGKQSIDSDDLCRVAQCSNLERHRQMLREAALVLERTKSSFKSRELGELRARINTFLES